MELTKLAIIVLFLAAKTCRGEIVIATLDNANATTGFTDDLINIVTTCYKGRINGVVLAGNLPAKLSRTLSSHHSIAVVVIDNVRNATSYRFKSIKYWQQQNVFVIEASTFDKLDYLISQDIKSSIWWNNLASFFIIDPSPGCVKRGKYLFLAFQFDILNAKVMCSHNESERIIYNYNPYTSNAPIPWERGEVINAIYQHPFTLFSREYRENETICVNLDFDKTLDTGRYPIQFSDWGGLKVEKFQPRSSLHAFRATRTRVLRSVIRALNSTARVNDKEAPDKDMRFNFYTRVMMYRPGMEKSAYLINNLPMNIVTHFRGHKSQLNKMLSVIDVESRIGIGVVYLVTLIFMKFLVHQPLVPVLLNIVRLTCSMGLEHLPNNAASRIYLGALFLFVSVMQMIVLCDLSTLLTIKVPLENVETFRDLEDFAYREICTNQNSRSLFEGTNLEKNVIFNNNSTYCVAYVGNTDGDVDDLVLNLNLHISSKPVQMQYRTFVIRWEWPLEQRINSILARMVEANVLEPWEVQCHPIIDTDFSVDLVMRNVQDFKSIELHEITFAFVFLAIGLACGFVVLIIELSVKHKHRIRCRVVGRWLG